MTTYLKPEYCWDGTIQKIQEMKDGKTVRIKGVAAHAGETSKNGRHYMRAALIRAVNTFLGVPVTINHAPLTPQQAKEEGLKFDPNMIVGNVEEMDFDEKTDTLTYVADIKKEPYVTLLRQGSPEIQGVSIQADYQHNKCPDCGQVGFENKGAFESHMAKEHFKHNIKAGPWGIIGRALSLVFGRQTPGLQTTVQLAESAIKGFDSLKETVEQFEIKKEERKTMKDELSGKASITTVQTVPWDQMETTSTPPIVEAKIPTQTAQKEAVVKEDLKIAEPCSPELRACVDALIADGKEESSAWAICKAKLGETVTPPKTIVLKEAVAIGKLVFNPKELYVPKGTSPEEYNRIFSETKQQNDSDQIVADTVNAIIDVVSKPMSVTFPEIRIPKDDMSWKETIANLPKDDLTWKETIATLATDDLSWKEELLKKADAESVTKELTEAKATIAKTTENLAKLEETFATTQKDYEKILNAAQAVGTENRKTLDEMKAELDKAHEKTEKLEAKVKESEEKKLKETAELEVRVDNVEDKLKGTFKGQNKQLEPETTTHTKPEDDMRKTVQRRN